MTSTLRAGVIGAGVFGGYHAGKYAELPGVSLAAVLDPHPERAAALARRHGAKPCGDLASFLAEIDIVSVAAPAVHHGRLALAVLEAGKSVYVEKPIAVNLKDADAIVAAAARLGLVAACGFLERAAFEAMGLFEIPVAPLRMECARRGAPSSRNLDVSVVIDLMIHDLDLALALTSAEPLAVEAEGACLANSLLDEAQAEVSFEDGFTARFRASRVAADRERSLTLVYPDGEVRLDLLTHAFENTTSFALNPEFEDDPRSRDRLGASLAAFVAAVRGEGVPLADAADGVRALDLALAVEQAVED
ncbi:MAG TPA: Gfo/Idh/MocA family oxidoreductase [Caulobacteraceae bacterium]|jgi:predicted dehydrogenase|nr:Gfo/Idh/MocA family oxidoreductase [Caulobacteraceae bacterium]